MYEVQCLMDLGLAKGSQKPPFVLSVLDVQAQDLHQQCFRQSAHQRRSSRKLRIRFRHQYGTYGGEPLHSAALDITDVHHLRELGKQWVVEFSIQLKVPTNQPCDHRRFAEQRRSLLVCAHYL